MQCVSCNADVPPQFVASIANNFCPICGKQIMDDQSQQLMTELKQAMQQMENADAEAIVGWLLSNYRLQRVGDAQPTKFHKVKENRTENVKIADNPVHKFLQRTGKLNDLENRKRLEELVKEVNGNLDNNLDNNLEQEYEEDYDSEEQLPQPRRSKKIPVNSEIIDESVDPPTPEEEEILNEAFANSGLHPALQMDRMKRLKAQQEVSFGGGSGKIRRSE